MPNTYEFSEIEHLHRKNTHQGFRVCCPFCSSIRGKEDKDFKLYYNTEKKVGYCFKCDSRVYTKEDKTIEDYLKNIDRAKNLLHTKKDILKKIEYKDEEYKFDMSKHKDIKEDKFVFEYLTKKRRLPYEICKRYNLLADNKSNIILSNTINSSGYSNYYQIRYKQSITDKDYKLPKYMSLKDVEKTIFFIEQIKNKGGELILCEGIISAISANLFFDKDVIAVLGKFLSEKQLLDLKKHFDKKDFSKIILMLDGDCIKEMFKLQGQLKLMGIPSEIVNLSDKQTGILKEGEDMNDLLMQMNDYDYNKLLQKFNFL